MWLSYLLRIRYSGRIGKPYAEGRASSLKRRSGLCGSYVPRAYRLEMLGGSVRYRRVRRLVMARLGVAWLVMVLRPGVMRPRMVRRRRRGRRVMGSGFDFRGSKNGGSGDCAEYGSEAKQERTTAEARGFGTLHNDLLWYGRFFLYRISDGFDFIIPIFLIVTTLSCFRILSYACGEEAKLKHLLQDGRLAEQLTPREKRLS